MKVIKEFKFSAAHRLNKMPEGHKCRRPHGHNYKVRIECEGDVNHGNDMVIDFFDIKKIVGPVIDSFDHRDLNEVINHTNPTAEVLCKYLWDSAADSLPLSAVEVWETDTCAARMEKP